MKPRFPLGSAALLLAGALAPLAAAPAPGPGTRPFPASDYAQVLHVDPRSGDDATGDGSAARPFASLPVALEQAAPAPGGRTAVLLSSGRYRQPTFALKPRVDLFGGFAAPGGPRDVLLHPSVLDGEEARRIALGADDARVDGIHFTGGRVRGRGAALLCDGVSPVLTNCVFTANRTLAPAGWDPPQLHLTAHDGGAVMCLNGAAPRLEHCLFFGNSTECGRGAALAADRGAAPVVRRSVLANNHTGIADPMRSSDGGAVSWFDHSAGDFSGNIVVGNRALARNDAGGLFVALWSQPRLTGNVIVGNEGTDDAGGLFIGGQEHRYGAPLDAYPDAGKFLVVVEGNVIAGNANSARNSGAMRVTMESRARLTGNIVAENAGGVYLQRSEIVAERNTVWQDWRFTEDKPSLGPSRLAGNILRGPLAGPVDTRVSFAGNMAEPGAAGADARPPEDIFLEDGAEGAVTATRWNAGTFTTVVTLARELPAAAGISGRPVLIGNGRGGQWRVIAGAEGRSLSIWGRLDAETKPPSRFSILRSFTVNPGAPSGLGAPPFQP